MGDGSGSSPISPGGWRPHRQCHDHLRHRRPHHELRRCLHRRILGGVAAGTADHLDIDVAVVRVGFATLTLLAGIGLPLYVAAWLLLPEPPLLIVVIAVVVAAATLPFTLAAWHLRWLLVVVAVVLVVYERRRRRPIHM